MKKKALFRDMLREVRRSKNRFFSIFAIVAIGTGFFSGVKVCCYDMKNTAASYFNDQNLFDFKVMTNYGLDDDSIAAIQATPGVSAVMPGYTADLFATVGDRAVVVKAFSYSPAFSGDEDMNRLVLQQGRLPQSADECVVETTYKTPDTFTIGSILHLYSDDEGDEDTGALVRSDFTVVGIARSPMYISLDRGKATIGDGSVSSFIYLHEDAFDSEVYTVAFLKMDGAEGLSPYEGQYEALANAMENRLEDLMPALALGRYTNIVTEAQEKIADAEADLTEARNKLYDAQREVDNGLNELADGEATLNRKEGEWTDGKNNAIASFAAAKAELEGYEAQLAQVKGTIAQLEPQLADLTPRREGYQALRTAVVAYLSAPEADKPAALAGVDAVAQGLGMTAEQAAGLTAGLAAAAPGIDPADDGAVDAFVGTALGNDPTMGPTLEAGFAALEENLLTLTTARDALEVNIPAGWEAYHSNYAAAWAKIDDGRAQLDGAWDAFAIEKADALAEIADARQEIADGWAEVADGEAELDDARADLADLAEGKGYTFDRDTDEGYASFGQDADRIDAVAKVFPVFFILVAALVCLTTMTRMVEEQRTQMGVVKALGYSSGDIAVKYLLYAAVASICGSLFGTAIGLKVIPLVIYQAYSIMYLLPDLIAPYLPPYFFWCTVVAVATTCVSAYIACRKELASVPAQLMRPKAPPRGKRVLLERVGFIWRRLSFTTKVTIRNLMRYKKRVSITVVGIAGCTALMLTGFGLKDSIGAVVSKQYDEISLYDAITAIDEDADPAAIARARAAADGYDGADTVLWANQSAADFKKDGKTYAGYLVAFARPDEMDKVITLRNRQTKAPLTVDDNTVIITEKISILLNLAVGDTFTLSVADRPDVTLTVGGIAENYVFHWAYISPGMYEKLFGQAPFNNMLYMNFKDGVDEEAQSAYAEALLKNDAVLTTSFSRDANKSFADLVQSLNSVVLVLIVSAAALAFVVLYNLTNINVTERTRELATIKVLGFYDNEVSAYIYRENVVCTILGTGAGLGLGIALHRFVVLTAEVDLVMFSRTIEPASFAFAALLTFVFAFAVNFVVHFSLKKISMVESMKSVE